jgi:hypothetical protein
MELWTRPERRKITASPIMLVISVCLVCSSYAAVAAEPLADDVVSLARTEIAKERLAEAWPFEDAKRVQEHSSRKVILHYFSPFPLSIDNKPASSDYYATQFLTEAGENGKYARVGGFIRERPLAVGPWAGPQWKSVNFAIEAIRAAALGADAFGVDLLQLNHGNYWETALELLNSVAVATPGFGIVPEPDMVALADASLEDLVDGLSNIWPRRGSYHMEDDRLLVAPFAAEKRSPLFWQQLAKVMLARRMPIALLPVLLNTRDAPAYASVSIGLSDWGAHDIVSHDRQTDKSAFEFARLTRRVWMQPIIPQDERPKAGSFWEPRGSTLFRQQWATARDRRADLAHIITWNDYGEGTEISPSSGIQFVYYDLAAYEIRWFKLGRPPPIRHDAIYYLHRRQLLDAHNAIGDDATMHLHGLTPLANSIEMIAFLTEPAEIEIEIGRDNTRRHAEAGLAVLAAPAELGRPSFRIIRNGRITLEKQSDWIIYPEANRIDPLYVGGCTTRDFIPAP